MVLRNVLCLLLFGGVFLVSPALAATNSLPDWVSKVGAQRQPTGTRNFSVNTYGASNDGGTLSTLAIQQAIDACADAGGGLVTFAPGRYLTGSLFIKSHVNLHLDSGVTLLGSEREEDYPVLPTRVAGIEMPWPAALLNVSEQNDVEISGDGTVDGQGEVWWKKYRDLRKAYEPRGLRWAADYDCTRARLLLIWKSSNVTLANLHLRRAGFWTVQITYADQVTVDGITISDNQGPSTDGVDIDSSRNVLVQHCDIDNNDDCICLKAGRDFDGLRVARPTEYIVIRQNIARHGGGVLSFGSETSGWIRHVLAYDLTGIGTSEGLRFKSARTRGGGIEDVLIHDVTMTDVPTVFSFTLDWNPSYSHATIPPGIKKIPAYWKIMATPVEPIQRGFADIRGLTIENIKATGASQILIAKGLAEKPNALGSVHWKNISAEGAHAGTVEYAHDWKMEKVRFITPSGAALQIDHSKNVDQPEAVIAGANLPASAPSPLPH